MGDTGEWDAVIDVSNVCWSPYLPPAGLRRPQLERLRLVMAAWRALHGDEAHFYLVADESLARAIDDDAGLNDLKESGDVGAIAVLSLAMVGITTVVIVIANWVGGGRDVGRLPARAAG